MHGVSAIIAIILILMIVVALAALSYTFFSGILTSTTSTTEESISKTTTGLAANMKIETISPGKIYVRNLGQTDLTELSIYVNDEAAHFNISPPVVKPGKVGTINLYDFVKGGDNIKITSSSGPIVSKSAPNPCDQAILCLSFDDCTAKDSSPHGNDGTLGSTPNPDVNDPTCVDSEYGKALSFDGTDDYINISNSESLNITGNEITIEAWIYLTEINFTNPILRKGSTQTNDVNEDGIVDYEDLNLAAAYYGLNGIFGEYYGPPWPRFDVNQDGLCDMRDTGSIGRDLGDTIPLWSLMQVENSTEVAPDFYITFYKLIFSVGNGIRVLSLKTFDSADLNKWYYIAGTYNGSTISLFINGQLDNSESATGNIDPINENLHTGSDFHVDYFSGIIDEVRIYNKAIY